MLRGFHGRSIGFQGVSEGPMSVPGCSRGFQGRSVGIPGSLQDLSGMFYGASGSLKGVQWGIQRHSGELSFRGFQEHFSNFNDIRGVPCEKRG